MKRLFSLVAVLALLVGAVGVYAQPVPPGFSNQCPSGPALPSKPGNDPDFLQNFVAVDDFPNNYSIAGAAYVGTLSWVIRDIVDFGGSVLNVASDGGHFGILELTTPLVTNAGIMIQLDGNTGVQLVGDLLTLKQARLDVWGVFKLVDTSGIRYRLGLMAPFTSTAVPTDGLYLRYDTSSSDVNFKFCSTSSSTETCIDTGVVADTKWHLFHLFTVDGQTIHVSMDRMASLCISSRADAPCRSAGVSLPATGFAPGATVTTTTADAKKVQIDLFGLTAQGLNPSYR